MNRRNREKSRTLLVYSYLFISFMIFTILILRSVSANVRDGSSWNKVPKSQYPTYDMWEYDLDG